jgi:hypothetical protein
MSILSIHDIQGISAFNNTVRIPSGHKLDVAENLKIPVHNNSNRPSGTQGNLGFNSETNELEIYDGSQWSSIGSGSKLDGSTQALAAPDAQFIWDNRPDQRSTMANAYKWILIPGESTPRQVWCNFENNGGGGPGGDRHGWMMMYQNYTGPRAAGSVTINGQSSGGQAQRQYTIMEGTTYYDNSLRPKKDGGQYICGKTHIWDIVKNQGNWDLMKAYNMYDSNGNVVSWDQSSTDSGNMSPWNQGAYCQSRPTRQVYDILMCRNVTFNDIFGSGISSGDDNLANYVNLYLDSGGHGGNFDWGETNELTISGNSNRGFSNNSNNESTPRMYGWAARHWISYSSNTTGRDAHRCQYVCWGSQNNILEISYYCRRNYQHGT